MILFIKTYWRSLLAVLVVFFLSVYNFLPIEKSIPTFPHSDKVIHLLMYAFLSFFLMLDYKRDNVFKQKRRFFYVILVLFPFVYGAAIEVVQEVFCISRNAEFLDWVADALGVFLGAGAAFIWLNRKRKNQPK